CDSPYVPLLLPYRCGQCCRGFNGQPSEAALTPVKLGHRLRQRGLAEVGPHDRREIQLRIRAFPQEEIAPALFAAGADEEIHIAACMARWFVFANGIRKKRTIRRALFECA